MLIVQWKPTSDEKESVGKQDAGFEWRENDCSTDDQEQYTSHLKVLRSVNDVQLFQEDGSARRRAIQSALSGEWQNRTRYQTGALLTVVQFTTEFKVLDCLHLQDELSRYLRQVQQLLAFRQKDKKELSLPLIPWKFKGAQPLFPTLSSIRKQSRTCEASSLAPEPSRIGWWVGTTGGASRSGSLVLSRSRAAKLFKAWKLVSELL